MKRSGTAIIFVIVWVAVLFAAFVIGICIKEVRVQRAGIESKAADIKPIVTDTKPVVSSEVQMPDSTDQLLQELSAKEPMSSSEGMMRGRNLPGGQRGGFETGRGNMGERFEGMSEEERQEAIAQMRERFGGDRRAGGGRLENLTEEERAKREEERRQTRERFENMTEEEREEFRAGMRDRFGGGRQPGGSGQGGRRRPGGRQEPGQQ